MDRLVQSRDTLLTSTFLQTGVKGHKWPIFNPFVMVLHTQFKYIPCVIYNCEGLGSLDRQLSLDHDHET